MGDMGDWLVDFVFGEVHAAGSRRPRARADHPRRATTLGSPTRRCAARGALRARRSFAEIEEAILQTAPYAGFPRAINALKVLRDEQEAVA